MPEEYNPSKAVTAIAALALLLCGFAIIIHYSNWQFAFGILCIMGAVKIEILLNNKQN